MSAIHVCGLSSLKNTIEASNARSVISLVNAGMEVPYPLSIPLEQRLRLTFNDIENKVPGFIEPQQQDVEKFLNFIENWNNEEPLIIHCWMGVSRSTAGALITLCALFPEKQEDELAQLIRKKSPEATPNKRLIALADSYLGRNGRMIKAIQKIGRGQDCFEGTPFHISLSDI